MTPENISPPPIHPRSPSVLPTGHDGAAVPIRAAPVIPTGGLSQMKKALSTFGLLAALVATISLSTIADGKTMTWKGWISDSACGAKGANADSKDCTVKCVKDKGAKWVFVDSKSKKVLPIHNQDAVSADSNLGMEVSVTGHTMDDGQLHVDKIAPAM